jgi:bifunctional UDP-N-acetylglucosamine pyrophosphorylase/glucosamine-1-phosphate N-acetyltransferase
MVKRSCLAIILAAGEGTRMRSAVPKVMHKVAGDPMLGHVIRAARGAGADRMAMVVGPDASAVEAFVGKTAPEASVHLQAERLGTAHAVLAAKKAFAPAPDDVLVLYGDTPLITPETLKALRRKLLKADLVVLGFTPADPAGYGRLLVEGKQLVAIREVKDASPAERAVRLCNAGVMAFRGALLPILKKIGTANANGEYYLTDLVELANRAKKTVAVLEADADEVIGVNDRAELAAAEALFQRGARTKAMAAGATLVAPETVFFSYDTKLGRDVTVEPNVIFGPGVTIADGVTVKGFSHFEGATIATGAIIGPFSRLRPGTAIGEGAHIGNFVEVKNAGIDAGAKANHLAYIGDAHVGAGANIGAGAVTCNYDGVLKHRTEIGAGAFIGTNSALIAPVTIGDGAYVGTGSVISQDVPPGDLAIARARQVNKPGYGTKLIAAKKAMKKGA